MLHCKIDRSKKWYFYSVLSGEFEQLFAVDKKIGSWKELMQYWNQIEPNLYFIYDRITDWTEHNIDIDEDDAELAVYIELVEV